MVCCGITMWRDCLMFKVAWRDVEKKRIKAVWYDATSVAWRGVVWRDLALSSVSWRLVVQRCAL